MRSWWVESQNLVGVVTNFLVGVAIGDWRVWSCWYNVVRLFITLKRLSYSINNLYTFHCYFNCTQVHTFVPPSPPPFYRSVTLEMPQGSFTLEPAMVSVNRTQKTVHGGWVVCAL